MTSQGKNAIDILLAESFKELAKTRPIEKITIKEITDKAGVIRPTFYNHFQDKYELLEWIVQKELMEPVEPLLNNGMLKEGVTFVLTAIEREKEFYMKAVQLEGQNSFTEVLKSCVANILIGHLAMDRLKEKVPYQWITPELIADYYAQQLCYVTVVWIKGGMSEPLMELVEIYSQIINLSIIEVIQHLQ